MPYCGIGNGTRRTDKHMTYGGAISFSSPPGKFAMLNEMAVVWEVDLDDEDSVQTKGW